MFTKCQLWDTHRTEMSLENIKAFLTSTLKPQQEKYVNIQTNHDLKKDEVENIYFSLFKAHNTLSKIKIKASLNNRINLQSITTELFKKHL